MKNEIEPVLINEEHLKGRIYIIRGQKVMLDFDLAEIYGYTTKRFNEQVKNNIEKFDDDFMFRLTNEELSLLFLRSKKSTLNKNNDKRGMHIKYLPYVFTEKGIYMLMTVLKGPLAIKQSKALIRLFDSMKNYIVENRELISTSELELRTQLLEKDVKDIKEDNKEIKIDLKKVMDNFNDPNTYKHFLILDGMKLEADNAYKKIFRLAKKTIIYIDDYVNLKTLSILSLAKPNINITLITDNKAKDKLTSFMINDYNTQNKNNKLSILKNNNKCHDRFIILDFNTKNEKIYHCGSSLKDAGNRITTIIEINDTKQYASILRKLLNNSSLKI